MGYWHKKHKYKGTRIMGSKTKNLEDAWEAGGQSYRALKEERSKRGESIDGEERKGGWFLFIMLMLVFLCILGYMMWADDGQMWETLKSTPWFRYVFLAIAMYGYANGR